MGRRKGFTIVELLVVIGVIGILAAITAIAYTNWKHTTIVNQVKSDLAQAASAMEQSKNFSNGYPATLPTTFTPSGNVSIVLTSTSSTDYCIDGTSTTDATVTYYIDNVIAKTGGQSGTCATRAAYAAAPAIPASLAFTSTTATTVTLSWATSTGATSYTLQCATDSSYVVNAQQTTTASLSATVTALPANSLIYCHVNATSTGGTSVWSSTVSAKTPIT